MRYYKFWAANPPGGEHDPWGASWWYVEFNAESSPTRQMMLYENGNRLRYSNEHLRDEYGEFLWDVLLDEWEVSEREEITGAEFENVWQSGPWMNDPSP